MLGWGGIFAYLIGLPVVITIILKHVQEKKLHTKRHALIAYGALYTKYQNNSWWCASTFILIARWWLVPMKGVNRYEIIQARAIQHLRCSTAQYCPMHSALAQSHPICSYDSQVLKRTAFAVVSVFDTNANVQCLIAQGVIVISTVLHFVCLPYVLSDRCGHASGRYVSHLCRYVYGGLDKLDCFYLMTLMTFALFGMTFSLFGEEDDPDPQPPLFQAQYYWMRSNLDYIAMIMWALAVTITLGDMIKELRKKYLKAFEPAYS